MTEPELPSEAAIPTPRKSRDHLVDRLLSLFGVRLLLWFWLAAAFLPGILVDVQKVGNHFDEHFHFQHDDAARRTMVDYGQLPVWDPYTCGGIPGAGNPQTTFLAPDFGLRLLFGTEPGRRLAILLFSILGLEGMFLLARKHDATATGAAVGAIIFTMSGRFTHLIDRGWLNMLPFYLFPWIVLAFEKGLKSTRWRIFGGALLGWMVLCGGTYTYPYAVVLLGLLMVVELGQNLFPAQREVGAKWYSPILAVVTMGAVSVAVSAVHVFPMLEIVTGNPRPVETRTHFSAPDLLSHLTKAATGDGIDWTLAYIGLSVLVLAAFGALTSNKAARRFGALAVAFFLLGMGDFGPWAPFTWLVELPVYGQLRWPQRFLLPVAMFVGLCAGLGVSVIERAPAQLLGYMHKRWARPAAPGCRADGRFSHRKFSEIGENRSWASEATNPNWARWAWVGGGVVALFVGWYAAYRIGDAIGLNLAASNAIRVGRVFNDAPPLYDPDAEFTQARGNRWDAHVWPGLNQGMLACLEANKLPQSLLLRADLEQEEYPLDPAVASVKRVSWTPNAIELEVDAKEETLVLVNQNYHRKWTADVGEVVDHEGLLAVAVPAGVATVTLKYRDWAFEAGFWLSLLTVLALLAGLGVSGWRWLGELRGRWRAWGSGP